MFKASAPSAALLTGMTLLMSASALSTRAFAQGGAATDPPPLTRGQSPNTPSPAPDAHATSPDVTGQPAPAPPSASVTTTPATAAQTGVVRDIKVEGNERIEADTVISYLPIAIGDTIDPPRLDLAIKTLFRTDLFADVALTLQPDGVLLVRVAENPIINRVVFEGNSALSDDKLRDEISIHPRGIFTKAKVQADVQKIVELYRRSGRISATVTPKIVELPQKRVDLVFEIKEGPKTGIIRVNFLGNHVFSDNALRDVVVT